MILTRSSIRSTEKWKAAGFNLPSFDIAEVEERTKIAPMWIHFGAGNIFRAFPAKLQQSLLDEGHSDRGIIIVEGSGREIIEKIFWPHDNLSVLVTLKSDGTTEKTVIASVVESLAMNMEYAEEWKRLKEIFMNESLQIVSLTITEKGYSLIDSKGDYLDSVQYDFESGPAETVSYMGKLTSLLYERFKAGKFPVALVSMDNCSHNGTRLYNSVHAYAERWIANKAVEKEFEDYINDSSLVSFPWSIIDKITPRPDESVKNMLKGSGLEDADIVITSKNTYVAPFVNAEESQYLVIEDQFPNGRPELEKAGVIFTDRETVDKVERMKVCTCLNPIHSALAIFGCLLGYKSIAHEMKDPQLKKMAEIIGYKEGLPVVVNPGIINPEDFLKEVLEIRFPNPFMPDTPQRIATDTSQKLSIRFGETIKAYIESESLDVKDLKIIPLVFAGWCRYLMGVDDDGKAFSPSPDPLLENMRLYLKNVRLGDSGDFHKVLQPILSNEIVFGVNLYDSELGKTAENYFKELVAKPGAVRATLCKYVN